MDISNLNDIFTVDFNLDSILALRQNQFRGAQFNYLDTTRRVSGLFLMREGCAHFTFPDGKSLTAKHGDVMLLPKDSRYRIVFEVPEGQLIHPLMVNFRATNLAGEDLNLGDRILRLCRDNGELFHLFNAAAQLYKGGSPAKLKAKVFELFGALFPLAESDECAIGYISRHYTDRFSIPALAEKCAMSETAYRKRFRVLTGQSPVQYINNLKIEKACQMLLSSDMRLNDISDFLNFYSPAYFYKVFRACTGMTPNEYKETQRKAN